MPRRLLVISYFHPPFAGAGGLRWQSMSRHLRNRGHTVTIVATDAFGRLRDDEQAGVTRVRDVRSNRHLRRVLGRGALTVAGSAPSVEVPPTALLTRVLVPDAQLLSWLPRALPAVRRLLAADAVDCLVTSSPPESVHLIGLLLGHRRPPWIADFRDGWSFEPLRDPFPTRAQRSLDRFLERTVATTAEVSIGAYAAVADDLKKRLRARAYHVPNAWDPEVAPRELPRASKVPRDTLTLVYTGTLSGVRALDPRPLLDALQTVRTEPGGSKIRLVIAGRLSRDERVLLGRSGLGSAVEHLGMLERAHALGLQRSADALVLLTARNASAATAKVFEYLAAGKPIIALAENNEAAEIVRDTNSGVLVAPDDVDAIATALRLAASGELAKHFAPRNLDRYTYPTPALAVEQLVEEAVDRHQHARRHVGAANRRGS